MNMQSRLHIQNDSHMVEFADSPGGMVCAKAFRRTQPAFKRRRIRKVLQAYPDRVKLGAFYELT